MGDNITENINHARHIETEIHTFTGIYMAVVAGVLAFDFSGRQGIGFGVMVHLVVLCGGLLAIMLLNRWYAGFDTHLASAECLSLLKEKLISEEITASEAVTVWRQFAAEYRMVAAPKKEQAEEVEKLIEKYKEGSKPPKIKKIAFGEVIEPRFGKYSSSDRLFAFSIPNKSFLSTRDYVYGFHGVILISIAIIIVKDLYSMIIL